MSRLIRLAIVLFLVTLSSRAMAADDKAGVEFFEKKIRPVLVKHCYKCHSAQSKPPKGGLRLDSRAGILDGGDAGEIVTPGDIEGSSLIGAISYTEEDIEMPPAGKLSAKIIADFKKWVEMGVPMPADGKTAAGPTPRAVDIEKGRKFWSFLPAKSIASPNVSNKKWVKKKLDAFVLRKLDEAKLQPAPAAHRATLIRRVSLDLTGLPPTYAEVQSFQTDKSPQSYHRLVDRLLSSKHYGERWGRHWLDVARYAEDNPTSESTCKPPPFPYPYRDWVIKAFNDDLPYDEFVKRQLAADLMDVAPSEIAATGFLGLSPVYHKEPKLSQEVISVIVADEWDERIDTVTRGFLGLTVTCARCHDHKFDPFTVEDYYALGGVMASTQLVEWPIVKTSAEEAASLTDIRLAIVDLELRLSYAKKMKTTAELKKRPSEKYAKRAAALQAELDAFKKRKLFSGQIANGVRDAGLWINGDDPAWTALDYKPGTSRDLPVFLRGSVTNHGKIVPRRFLAVLSKGTPKPFGKGSGRLELAENIVGQAGSLTARVIVNRVWGWHFGRPLVITPSNFGQLGARPTHPKLLDDLAARFIANGWSLKWLHREIVLSSTYRQSSVGSEAGANADLENKLLWRMPRRRLEPEAWRDSVLFTSGELDETAGGPSIDLNDKNNMRRTAYGIVSRQRPAHLLQLFDFPDAKFHSDRRVLTTTPLQQLYLINSQFLQDRATKLTDLVLGQEKRSTPERIVGALFQKVYLRNPNEVETAGALKLVLTDGKAPTAKNWQTLAHALLASNEFLYVD